MSDLATRLRDEAGQTLTELLIVAAMVPVVLGAALSTATSFDSNVRRNQDLNESQARTREAIDQLSRNLRNLASPTPEQPQAVDKVDPYDLVFQTVNPGGAGTGGNPANVRRVRYCLEAGTTAPKKLWAQTQSWTSTTAPAVPSTATCPASGWGNQRVLAQGLTNRLNGQNRPLFQFNSNTPSAVNAIIVQAWLAGGNGTEPSQGVLRSQVFLRNQNEAPVASPTATPGGQLRVVLNGSASYDPEGQELTYRWYEGTTFLGSGIVLQSTLATAGTHTITLKVYDPAGLEGTATTTVQVLT
jgi:type II secretory pathway pseudopilin PulG